ncbi:MAG: hypothetical protein JOY57_14575 [Actinobacteria bacterium]|nr:hypothetical protein [Actinomycetota bacterium]
MLDHLFLDAIAAMRSALEGALLERHAAEEHLHADILLGDLTWETSYSLPGEGLLPRVRVDVTFDWSTWSQSAYRSWMIGEPADEPPELMIELAIRLGRLRAQPDLTTVLAILPETGPSVGADPLERSAPAVEVLHDSDLEVVEAAVEVSYEGIYVATEEVLEDPKLLVAHFAGLGGWLASALVRLTDLPLDFLPPETESEIS